MLAELLTMMIFKQQILGQNEYRLNNCKVYEIERAKNKISRSQKQTWRDWKLYDGEFWDDK